MEEAMKEETHWADDVCQYYASESAVLRDCECCGSERTIPLWVIGTGPVEIGTIELICESCATLSKEEREEVRCNKDDKPIPYVLNEERCQPSSDDSIWSDTVNLEQASHCPYPKYDGSTWDYCGEGFKIFWKNNKWTAHSIKPSGKWNPSFPVHSDPSEIDEEEDGFWKLIEYSMKPKKNVSFGWDPYGLG
jgi:hypothetical protein